ncbi:hypothetical protein ACFQU7_05025 [Pseudoroseomonas wenyumeiae]
MTPTRRAFLASGAVLPFLRGPARAQPADGTLRFGLSAYPPNLQPWVSTGGAAGTVKMLLHRRLVSYNAKGELRGNWRNPGRVIRPTGPGSSSCARTRHSRMGSRSPPPISAGM